MRKADEEFRPSVLIYHVYLVNNWKELSRKLLAGVPHDDIYINVSIDWYRAPILLSALSFFKSFPKVKGVFVTRNRKALAEVAGFDKLRNNIDWTPYRMLSYMHGKGVTKPKNKNIKDWVELMRYYIIDQMPLCTNAFSKGYQMYGVNLDIVPLDQSSRPQDDRYGPYKFSDFHFSGNFVTINLQALKEKFLTTPVDQDYFGVEGYWGKLCPLEKVFCAYSSRINNHYKEPYPEHIYKKNGHNQKVDQKQ